MNTILHWTAIVVLWTHAAGRESRQTTGHCDRNFVKYGNSCYHAIRAIGSWPETLVLCEALGAELAVIEDAAEQAFIENYLGSSAVRGSRQHDQDEEYWIGATDIIKEGQFQWAVRLDKVAYSKWASGQPDNSHNYEHCALLTGDHHFSWNDDQCENKHYALCEKKAM